MSSSTKTSERYGPVALVAGASEGLGAAFGRALALRGLDLVLLARRSEALARTADDIRQTYGVNVHTEVVDLASADLVPTMQRLARSYEIGLVVYNAAYAPVGPMLDQSPDELLRAIDVNVRGPLLLLRTLVPAMTRRGRGGFVLMSSLAGSQGTPRLSTYAATKAFNTVLGEGMWGELRSQGIDVLVSCAGAIATPGYARAATGTRPAPGTLDADVVARRTLDGLGRGPRVTPGLLNKLASFIVGRLLPRRLAIAVMAASTRDLT